MDFKVLTASDSLISMQFNVYMKLPRFSNLSFNPLKEDLRSIPPHYFKADRNVRVKKKTLLK